MPETVNPVDPPTESQIGQENSVEPPKVVPAITSEEEFHEKLEEVKEKSHNTTDSERFRPLAEALHEKLRLQDSEAALVIMTKGALGLGTSDIHYDTSDKNIAIRIRID